MEKVSQVAITSFAIVVVFWTFAFLFYPQSIGHLLYKADEIRYPEYFCE